MSSKYNPLGIKLKAEKYGLSIKNKTIYGPDMQPKGRATKEQIAYMMGWLDHSRETSELWCYKNNRTPKSKYRSYKNKRVKEDLKGPSWL